MGLFLLTVIEEQSLDLDSIAFMIVVLFYSLLGNFVYGLPASIVADFISNRYFNIRFWLSGLIHIGFGFGTYFIIHVLFMPAIICSVMFFIFDEITKKYLTSY
jgi:hypothetical protein